MSMIKSGFWEHLTDNISMPDEIYHYTNANGLIGIFQSNLIWGTDYRILNDAAEIVRFCQVFAERVLDSIDLDIYEPIDLHVGIRTRFIDMFYSILATYNVCIVSFSLYGNSLNHWDRYAGPAGYAIGFKFKNLQSIGLKQKYYIAPVSYCSVSDISSLSDSIIQDNRESIAKFASTLEHDKALKLCGFIINLALTVAPFFKREEFSDEKEVRLVKTIGCNEADKLLFRATEKNGIAPYIPLHFKVSKKGIPMKSPVENLITKIVVGPGDRNEWLQVESTSRLAKKHGYNLEVCASDSSYKHQK